MREIEKIIILMASYNGSKFINEQLDSIIIQTYSNWELIIRDDGSNDGTTVIIDEYIKNDSRISKLINKTGIKGSCSNFSYLLSSVRNRPDVAYVMFADQDDIWTASKVSESITAAKDAELQHPNEPVLIYTDLQLVDGNNNIIPGQLKIKRNIFLNSLIIYNSVLGCTMLLNKPLIDKIGNIPYDAENHDYWIALVASIYNIKFIDQKLIRYRQHNFNASGNVAGNNSMSARIKRHFLATDKEIRVQKRKLRMLENFLYKYEKELSPYNSKMLKTYLQAYKQNRFKVIYIMLMDNIFKRGFIQTLASFYHVLIFYSRLKTY